MEERLNANQQKIVDATVNRMVGVWAKGDKQGYCPYPKEVIVVSEPGENTISSETPYLLKDDYLRDQPCAFLRLVTTLPCTLYYYVTGQSNRIQHPETITARRPFIWDVKFSEATLDKIDVVPNTDAATTVKFVCSTVSLIIALEESDIITDRRIYKKSEDIGAIAAGAEMSAGVDLVVEKDTVNQMTVKNIAMVLNEDTDLRVKFYSHDSDQGTDEDSNMFLGYQDLTDPFLDSGEYVRSIDCNIALHDADGSGEIHYIVENIGSTATTTGYLKFIIEEESV